MIGDGVALNAGGGPHFAPINPAIGTVHYCAISEATYVYGESGWAISNVTAHPAVAAKEDARIRAGLAKLINDGEEVEVFEGIGER